VDNSVNRQSQAVTANSPDSDSLVNTNIKKLFNFFVPLSPRRACASRQWGSTIFPGSQVTDHGSRTTGHGPRPTNMPPPAPEMLIGNCTKPQKLVLSVFILSGVEVVEGSPIFLLPRPPNPVPSPICPLTPDPWPLVPILQICLANPSHPCYTYFDDGESSNSFFVHRPSWPQRPAPAPQGAINTQQQKTI
jgi:hypothetical protein